MIEFNKLKDKEIKLYLLNKSRYYPYIHRGTKTIS